MAMAWQPRHGRQRRGALAMDQPELDRNDDPNERLVAMQRDLWAPLQLFRAGRLTIAQLNAAGRAAGKALAAERARLRRR